MLPDLGRYRIESEIGRGAMGTVYRALDTVLERPVAVKVLNSDLPDDELPEMRARFVREARSAGRLNHPNIVTIYDVGFAGEEAYIAMEYLEGESLQQLMKSGASLSFNRAVDIVAQVAEGLDYAGRFGIVHRDIKPANIMVSPSGVAKITDFGVARVPSSSMTEAGKLLGSPKYMAPEQVEEKPLDPRADIFSLGVVLYEMLAGKTPFERPDQDVLSLLDLIVKEPAAPLSAQRPELPAHLDGILELALAKNPAHRFPRAGDFAARLRMLSAPAATAQFEVDAEPTGEAFAPQQSLSKLLSELEAFSRQTPSAQAANELSLQLRKAFHYLEELVRRVIDARPPFAVKLDALYLGALPSAELSDGRVECTTKKIDGGEAVDCVKLTYRMSSSRKARVALGREDAERFKGVLREAGFKYDSRQVTDEAGAVRFEAFLIDVELAASATLRGDYERQTVDIACHNVGVLGRARYRLASGEFDEAIWEFGPLLFGQPSRFAGLRLPF